MPLIFTFMSINEETGKVIKNVTLRKLADEYSNTDRDADEMYYI